MIGFVLGLDVVPRDRSWSPSRRRDVADRRTGTRGAPLAARRRSASCPAPRRVVDQYARGTRRSPKVADPRPRKRDLIKNAFNQLLELNEAAGRTVFAYDLNGNQTTKSEPGGDVTTLTWDARDRLEQIDLPGGVVSRFGYDTQNLRVFMDDSDGVRRLLLDGIEEMAEYDKVSSDRLARFDHDPTRLDALFAQKAFAAKVEALTDALGTVHELADEAAQEPSRFSYDVWGQRTSVVENIGTPWGFQGRRHNADSSNLVYFRERYAAPQQAAFLSDDPARTVLGSEGIVDSRHGSGYLYLDGAPSVRRDPLGLLTALDCIVGAGFSWGTLAFLDMAQYEVAEFFLYNIIFTIGEYAAMNVSRILGGECPACVDAVVTGDGIFTSLAGRRIPTYLRLGLGRWVGRSTRYRADENHYGSILEEQIGLGRAAVEVCTACSKAPVRGLGALWLFVAAWEVPNLHRGLGPN